MSKKASPKKKHARMEKDMHELDTGPVNAPSRKAAMKHGTLKKQNVAIALKNSGLSKKKKAAKK